MNTSTCVKCGKDTNARYRNCDRCNPKKLLIACKCRGCQCEGGYTIDGDWIPKGFGWNVDGNLIPIPRNRNYPKVIIPSTT